MRIRDLQERDRPRIGEMVIAAGNFNDAEVETALELVDEALADGDASGYFFLVLGEDDGGLETARQALGCSSGTPMSPARPTA